MLSGLLWRSAARAGHHLALFFRSEARKSRKMLFVQHDLVCSSCPVLSPEGLQQSLSPLHGHEGN